MTSSPIALSSVSSSCDFRLRAIKRAIVFISLSLSPRVVTAGVPRRIPLVTNGDSGSSGMVFLLVVMWA